MARRSVLVWSGPMAGRRIPPTSGIVPVLDQRGRIRNLLHELRTIKDGAPDLLGQQVFVFTGATAWVSFHAKHDDAAAAPAKRRLHKYQATTLTPMEQKFLQRA